MLKKYIMKNVLLLITYLSFSGVILCQEKNKTVKDFDGNVYNTLIIGDQLWMKENLRTTHFTNGDQIPTTRPDAKNITSEEEPVYQWVYDGLDKNEENYGRLYTWYAAADSRNICPDGWRLPSQAEWAGMIRHLGGDDKAGGKLKATGFEFWEEPNTGANNESGFTALPSGGRNEDGTFSGLGKYAAWWTSTEGMFRNIEHDEPYTFRYYFYRSPFLGLSVRCIKD
jgi:uncharacterized protein (TIGR02145 family)